ncbi:MAG TPA: MBL fold metallo-hydrolase [Steroidobacteraceae bacterium]|jgi:glyoxylase-like metal-dependent hydrolase (beta-lactamase superfamily II)|nr:MBL fold metallo-hydrolase [Steroidobacteraceae bacterium]
MKTGKACAASTIARMVATIFLLPTLAMAAKLDRSLIHAADKLRLQAIQSVEFEAHGKYFQFTQAPAPGLPWPPFIVDDYVATLDYARAAVHAKYHRVQEQEPGRERPPAEATMDQYAVDGVSWNLAPGPTAIPSNLAERNAELWASPHGFVKAALANHASVRRVKEGLSVNFKLGKYGYEGLINSQGDLAHVRTFMDSAVLGDTPIEWRYSEYRDFDGVRFPTRIERLVAGMPWYQLSVSALRINNAVAFAVPAEVAANPSPSVSEVVVTELASGVVHLGGGTHNSLAIEQRDGIVVIEAPLNEERSLAIIAKVRELFPGKKIRRVINTHAHFDHAGGLRTFVAEGAIVVTHERNAAYYARAWRAPRRLNPDRLAKSDRKPRFETFTTRLVLADAERPIEIHRIEGSGHNDAFAMVYLPAQKILIEADAWTPTPAGATPPAMVSPLWMNLYQNIERLGLDVQRIAPLHGTVKAIADFRTALRLPERAPN